MRDFIKDQTRTVFFNAYMALDRNYEDARAYAQAAYEHLVVIPEEKDKWPEWSTKNLPSPTSVYLQVYILFISLRKLFTRRR